MPFVKVGTLSGLPPGQMLEVLLDDERYVVCNVNGTLHAISGFCPHSGGPLGQGALHDAIVVCPWHSWEFDCRTGANPNHPSVSVPRFDVKTEAGDILLDVPEDDD